VTKGVPGRLSPRIFLTFGITRVVNRQPYVPAAFTPGENPWYSLSEAESTSGHMVPSGGAMEKPPATPPGIDPGTVRLVALRYPRPHDLHDVKLMTRDVCINNVSYLLLNSKNVKYVRMDKR
jgi:hypothetical protein